MIGSFLLSGILGIAVAIGVRGRKRLEERSEREPRAFVDQTHASRSTITHDSKALQALLVSFLFATAILVLVGIYGAHDVASQADNYAFTFVTIFAFPASAALFFTYFALDALIGYEAYFSDRIEVRKLFSHKVIPHDSIISVAPQYLPASVAYHVRYALPDGAKKKVRLTALKATMRPFLEWLDNNPALIDKYRYPKPAGR